MGVEGQRDPAGSETVDRWYLYRFEDNQTIRATDNGGTRCAAGTMRGFDAYGNVLVDMTLV